MPIWARLSTRRLSRPHTLDASIRVGERPIFFGERGRGQEDICKCARLVDEQILRDEKFEMRHVFACLVKIRLGHHRVLAHDEQSPYSTLMRVTENFSGRETKLARETARLDVPGL